MLLKVENLKKSFKGGVAVNDVSFSVNPSEIVTIIGPSGSGKSTLLRLIAGLEQLENGSIFIQDTLKTKLNERSLQKNIGFIFQDFALFDHLNVYQNIALSPKVVYKTTKREIDTKVDGLLKQVRLENKKNSYPSELSGGEKQRIAISRALITAPSLLLLDEPTSALDYASVQLLTTLLLNLKESGLGILLVTHDLVFANAVSDRLLFMKNSSIIFNKRIESIELDDFIGLDS